MQNKNWNDHKRIKPCGKEDARFRYSDPVEGEGSVATTMQGTVGSWSTLYIIGDYLYCNGSIRQDQVRTRCRYSKKCRRYAYLEAETLKVIKFTGEHSCLKDPDLRFQIQMESEMKERAVASAQASKASFREIYDTVCKKNPRVASRIAFPRMYKTMDLRWRRANSTAYH